jgi:hypothetical protein
LRKRSKFLLVAVFGLLPFWISLAVLLAGVAEHGHSGEYAAAAGWYPLMGAFLSGYTLVVAILTVLVHDAVRGDAARKRRIATITLSAGTVVSLALMGWPYFRAAQNDKYNEQQEARVLEFVRSSDIVRRTMPEPFDVAMDGGSLGRDGRQWRFEVRIQPIAGPSANPRPIYAIVDVLNQGPLIRCFTRQSARDRESSNPCQGSITTGEIGPEGS